MSAIKYGYSIESLTNIPVYIQDLRNSACLSVAYNNDNNVYLRVKLPPPNNHQQWILKYYSVYKAYMIIDAKFGWHIASGQNNDDRAWHDAPTQSPSNKLWWITQVVPGSNSGGFYIRDTRWGEAIGGGDVFDGNIHHQPARGRSSFMWDIIIADTNSYCGTSDMFPNPVCQELSTSNPTLYNHIANGYCAGSDGGKSRLITNAQCSAWCRANPNLCNVTMTRYCQANPSAPECRCIYGSSQPDYIAVRSKYPEIVAPVACWPESGCQGANLIDVLVTTDRQVELNNCPNVTVMRQNIDIANSGVIGSVGIQQEQTSTVTTITQPAPIVTDGGSATGGGTSTNVATTTVPGTTVGTTTGTTNTTTVIRSNTVEPGQTINYSGNQPLDATVNSNMMLIVLMFIIILIIASGIAIFLLWDDEGVSEFGESATGESAEVAM